MRTWLAHFFDADVPANTRKIVKKKVRLMKNKENSIFGHFRVAESSCEHNTIFSVDMVNLLEKNSYLFTHPADTEQHWHSCGVVSWPTWPIFFLPTLLREIWLFSCWMLHYANQLVSNCVCLLFSAAKMMLAGWQWTQTVKLQAWKPKQLPERP